MDYRTEDGSANAGSDYEYSEGTLVFKPGETCKEIKVSKGKREGEREGVGNMRSYCENKYSGVGFRQIYTKCGMEGAVRLCSCKTWKGI